MKVEHVCKKHFGQIWCERCDECVDQHLSYTVLTMVQTAKNGGESVMLWACLLSKEPEYLILENMALLHLKYQVILNKMG